MSAPPVFYTHVMKTGGTSLHRALQSHFGRDNSYPREIDGPATVATKTFSHLLLDMDAETRSRYRYFCVHQPAWVAFEATPDARRITVLREPVARTVSHLRQLWRSPHTTGDVTEIYDDPTWRDRLANHQTQFFADTHELHRTPDGEADDADMSDPEVKHRFEQGLIRFWGTAIKSPIAIGDDELRRATAVLDRFDHVGITEDLESLAERLRRSLAIDIPALGRENTTEQREPVPDELLARIEADNQYDLALYAHARELAGA